MTNNAPDRAIWACFNADGQFVGAHNESVQGWDRYTQAAAHDALAAKLAQVEAERDDSNEHNERLIRAMMDQTNELVIIRQERDAAHAENAVLREALQPFADEAECWSPEENNNELIEDTFQLNCEENALTVGDLRRASAALQPKDNAGE